MPYSQGTTAKLTLLKNNANLMGTNTCHDGASQVCTLLKQRHTKRPLAGTPNFLLGALVDGLYRLDISTKEAGPDPNGTTHYICNYDHSLVLLKNGADLALLQCWSRRYTMSHWLHVQGVLAGTWCGIMYSPGSETTSTDSVKNWTVNLPRLQTVYNVRNWEPFDKIAKMMFAADSTKPTTQQGSRG